MSADLQPIWSPMDVIYLFYGLAFVLLGLSILLLPKEGISSRLLPSLWLLAVFGITHGLKEWVFLSGSLTGRPGAVAVVETQLLIVSYAFLFEFGRRLTRACESSCRPRPWLARMTSPWVYALVGFGLLAGTALDSIAGLAASARYLLGFPGSLLAAFGLLLCVRNEEPTVKSRLLGLPFHSAAAAFLLYAVFGGLVVKRGGLFPASVLNETSFLSVVGIPVQLFRAFCAAMILVTVAAVLRVYHTEVKRRLRIALEDARSALGAMREAQRHLRQSAMVLEHLPEGVVIADARGRIESVNPAFEKSTGYSRSELVGRTPRMLRSPRHDLPFYRGIWTALRENSRWQGEIWIRRKDDEIHPEWLSINALRDAQERPANYIGILSDVETHHEVKQRLHRLAYYDGLTDLPNRLLFRDRLDLSLAHARRERQRVAVMFIDLDRFKHINDTLGHKTGDQILQAVAERIKRAVREGDTIARIGGDEFTVILPGFVAPSAATHVARKILEALESPFCIAGRELHITASIGISIYPEDGKNGASLTRKADIAMYRAKELGRNHYRLYERRMSVEFRKKVFLENELRRALDRGQMYLVYQPQVDLQTGRMVGVEALARWRHPQLGLVPPATFIPIAEETDLIDRIGQWVLFTACDEIQPWAALQPEALRVSVNVSARQLYRGEFPETVADVLERTSMSPAGLALELTESIMAEHVAAHGAALSSLSEMGVQITIDDFGTGYSSLGYLKRFSVDKLKIDQSFVRDIPKDANDCALASMIIALAHASNMRVTAEGVETADQLEFLREHGCDEIQGFLIGKPVPASALTRMIGPAGGPTREAIRRHLLPVAVPRE